MQSLDFEAEISALIDELSSAQSELLEVLAQKRSALAAADLQSLAELQPREEQLASRLSHCQRRRSELLAAAGQEGLPSENMAKLAMNLGNGKRGALGQKVKAASAR